MQLLLCHNNKNQQTLYKHSPLGESKHSALGASFRLFAERGCLTAKCNLNQRKDSDSY